MSYENLMSDEKEYLRNVCLPDQPVLVDVGCNIGSFAQGFMAFHPGGTVWAFEPLERLAGALRKTFTSPSFHLYSCALGDRNGTVEFFDYRRNVGECSSLYARPKFPGEKISVPLRTLDSFYPDPIGHIDYLKIDTEGNEYNVLLGARKMIEDRRISYIQFEYGDCYSIAGITLNQIIRLLYPHYTIYHPKYGELNLDFDLSNELVINFLAELRK